MISDLRLLGAALLLACLPWSPGAALTLVIVLLALQLLLLVLVLSGSRPVELCELLLDGCLGASLIFTRASWLQPERQSWLLLPVILVEMVFLYFMLRHTRAHRQMQLESDDRLQFRFGNIQEDLDSRLIDLESAEEKRGHFREEHQEVSEIFRLGSQTAGVALIQMSCLVFSQPFDFSWLVWWLSLILATFLNSKAQDLMLKHYLPEDNRLC